MITEFWIEKGWGDSVDNATFDDISVAIEEIIKMEEEHGAFWVGHLSKEYVLEVHKDLNVFFVYGENQDEQIQVRVANLEEAKHFYQLFFTNEFEQLRSEIELRPFLYRRLQNE